MPLGNRPRIDELRLEPLLSITEELRKVRTGKPLEEILSGLGIP